MGCKCTHSGEEEEDEIKAKEQTEEYINLTEQKSNQYSPNSHDNNQYLLRNTDNNFNNITDSKNNEYQVPENIQRNSNDVNDEQKHNEEYNLKYSNYSEKIVELINSIRQDPPSYADYIEDSIKNIVDDNNKNDSSKTKIIYKQKIKVALTRGEPAFHEAAKILRNTGPLPPFEFVSNMCITLPDTEEEIKDSTYLKRKVKELRDEGIAITVFFKDLVKIPEVSALLMIVDDSSKNAGKKRMALLNKDFRYIGVSSKFIGKTFIAYLTFS